MKIIGYVIFPDIKMIIYIIFELNVLKQKNNFEGYKKIFITFHLFNVYE